MPSDNPEYVHINEIDALREEIDMCDAMIISYILYRTSLSKQIGKIKIEKSINLIDSEREKHIHEKYQQLGGCGRSIAENILTLGRGKLGENIKHQNINDQ